MCVYRQVCMYNFQEVLYGWSWQAPRKAEPGGSSRGRGPAGQVSRRWMRGAARASRSYDYFMFAPPLSAAPPARFTIRALDEPCQTATESTHPS